MAAPDPPSPSRLPLQLGALPGGIWVLGFASLLMDTSSELVHGLLPVFMASTLGAGMVTIGLVEGVAEAMASITRIFSGVLSDRFGRRKLLVVFGYALGAATKPVFPLASSIGWVMGARVVDRLGKGIRQAPRDALVADITPPALRGAAYGLRQSLDSVGAFVGPLLAVALMIWFSNDIRTVLWAAVLPAVATVALLVAAVREPPSAGGRGGSHAPVTAADLRLLPRRYWVVVFLGAVLSMARFSDAFLVLRAQDVGFSAGYVPVVMMVLSAVYAAVALPAGIAADRFNRRTLLAGGLLSLVAADLVLAAAATPVHVLAGTSLWGLHLGLTQGLLAKLVADTATARLRGTAFGVFHIVSGIALLAASVMAGALWNTLGPPATFVAGAAFAALALMGLLAREARA